MKERERQRVSCCSATGYVDIWSSRAAAYIHLTSNKRRHLHSLVSSFSVKYIAVKRLLSLALVGVGP